MPPSSGSRSDSGLRSAATATPGVRNSPVTVPMTAPDAPDDQGTRDHGAQGSLEAGQDAGETADGSPPRTPRRVRPPS